MKKKRSVLAGFAVLFLAAVFTMGGCDTGVGSAESVTYRTTSGGKTYTLVITASSGRAAYAPKSGDRYELTISPDNTRSVGTVTANTGTVLTLKPANAASSFTVTVKTAGTEGASGEISAITGTVTLEDGNTLPGSGIVKPGTGGGGGSSSGGSSSSGNNGSNESEDEFTFPLPSVARAEAYLAYLVKTGDPRGSAANPIVLPMQMNLGNGVDTLANLFSLIATKGKYVDLDLARCYNMLTTEFDPGTANTGEGRVVSLVLPDLAESIKDGIVTLDDGHYSYDPIFRYFTSLKRVSGNTIKTIGVSAFYDCPSLTTVNFPALTSIGHGAFACCTALTIADFPVVTSIGDDAFGGCTSLETVNLPMLTSVSWGAFDNCPSLTMVNLPEVASIDDWAFAGCTFLPTVDIPKVETIGYNAFIDCTNLTEVDFPVATSIDDQAFANCTSLETVNLPAATDIGLTAFGGCTSLETVKLPVLASIDYFAFWRTGTKALTITLPEAAPRIDVVVGEDFEAYAKTVTIKLPVDRTGYDATWKETFKTKMFGDSATIDLRFEDL
jgi:hypothetical protein